MLLHDFRNARFISTSAFVNAESLLGAVIEHVDGELRAGQQEMVNEISAAIESNEHRIIQAGTGTGKSLGYLVPAALHASTQNADPVVIATATLALQKQLMDKDLPVVAVVLKEKYGLDLQYSVLKGRSNYVCLQKLNASVPDSDQDALFESPSSALGIQSLAVREWAEATATGDRDDYPNDIDPRVWRSFSVSSRECVGEAKCAYGADCFAAKRRLEAANSQIVITNHALLAIEVIEGIPVLPPHEIVVIDEGHELVDKVTNATTREIGLTHVERALSAAQNVIDERTIKLAEEAAQAFDQALAESTETPDGITRLTSLSQSLIIAMTLVRDAFQAAISEMGSVKSEDPDQVAKNHRIRGGLEEVHDIAGEILNSVNTLGENFVVWIDAAGHPPILRLAPLSVAHVLREKLFENRVVIVTSATLMARGNFDSISQGIGVHEDPRAKSIDVGSPFDYRAQGILYVATDVQGPSRDGISMEALDAMGELIEAAGGRTLILCSSWRAVDKAAEYLRVRIQTPLLVQRKGESVGLLVEKFSNDEVSSLIGTLSLWQGVDVPGRSCSQVIIDRIPFPRPDDPVLSARSQSVDRAGGSGFNSVMVTRAGLLLAQAAGRLIRNTADRGVVSVLDPRLATAGYGISLRNSMPPLWFTTDKEITIQALKRLSQSS
jgi:ATP-dependent DNA helicase DinG